MKIEWARTWMPVLNMVRDELIEDRSVRGRRIAVILPIEPKTAYLAAMLKEKEDELQMEKEFRLDTEKVLKEERKRVEHLKAELENHPIAVAGQAALEPRGESEALFERMLEVLEAANEDPSGFRVTSRYVIAMAERK